MVRRKKSKVIEVISGGLAGGIITGALFGSIIGLPGAIVGGSLGFGTQVTRELVKYKRR